MTAALPTSDCAGPVIYAYKARVELIGCTVRDTVGGFRSGGLMLVGASGLVINCTFTRLEAEWSTAIYLYYPLMGSSLIVESSVFHDNVARSASIIFTCASFQDINPRERRRLMTEFLSCTRRA